MKSPEQYRRDYELRIERQRQRDRIRKVPFPGPWANAGNGWCVWCGRLIIDAKTGMRSKRAHWHKDCVHEYNLHSRLETQFNHVAARDGLKCAWPGCGATPERWIASPVMHLLDYSDGKRGLDVYWSAILLRDIPWNERTEEQHSIGAMQDIDRRCALQLDHKTPLWKVADLPDCLRRSYFGPDNLWLLCPDHHKAKTRREAAERAHQKRLDKSQVELPI